MGKYKIERVFCIIYIFLSLFYIKITGAHIDNLESEIMNIRENEEILLQKMNDTMNMVKEKEEKVYRYYE